MNNIKNYKRKKWWKNCIFWWKKLYFKSDGPENPKGLEFEIFRRAKRPG